ncbi:M20/M25/M40 family metallo-hydrolase [Clostridium sp. D2Q-14]|uniref:M20/M25/M40 family metallo-hydrolase n=1 Tax=Anaeromonas gelatinilytica TaxID=2683194 RepID=UPI00193AE7BA|nr:M20/M25/M40 family metallo-hydrolase [Anaeromonas gelatinilytica]MBS4536258.1 M20/M25/M40 family metallo-hydrolase [Anaeromonas gelatinilytica]
MNIKDFLKELSNSTSVSGYESNITNNIVNVFSKYSDKIDYDQLGSIIAIKKGVNNFSNLKIMLAAHVDEIGLMVKDFDDSGTIRFTSIGGIDPRTLVAQEVIVHGKKELFGVIGTTPPHLQDKDKSDDAFKMNDLYIDVGYDKDEVKKIISIGDIITIKRNFTELQGGSVTGKALDDKAGIVTMLQCAKELMKLNHEADIYFVSTIQEEVGTRGAITSTYKINPDIGIAIDVGFGRTPELDKSQSLEIKGGPGITIGGNIHPNLRQKLVDTAEEYNIPYQFEVESGPTGTDARSIQISRAGIPSLLISLPLRYMHTSVETIHMEDIKKSGNLIARFISEITSDNLEGYLCY